MYYDKQPKEQREAYKSMLQVMGRLSRLFSDAEEPYLYYRIHENVFAKFFDVENNARHDDSVDAYSIKDKIGIGLKTWVGGDNQKVAEFGKLRPEYKDLKGKDLIERISTYRNKRIKTTMNSHGINKMVYHIVKRIQNRMLIYECDYDFIDIDRIRLLSSRGNDNSVYFTDGKHTYKFSLSKNTLYMDFENMTELDSIDISIIPDPYKILEEKAGHPIMEANSYLYGAKVAENSSLKELNYERNPEQLCLRLYSTKGNNKFVPEKSGLNQWNAGGRRRDYNEVYIPYPAVDRERGTFFPPRKESFNLRLPDGKIIKAAVCQADGKAIMSNPNSELGKWLLRSVFELKEGEMLTYEMLKVFGVDSVMFTKNAYGEYSVDFCKLGTYEQYYGIELEELENEE